MERGRRIRETPGRPGWTSPEHAGRTGPEGPLHGPHGRSLARPPAGGSARSGPGPALAPDGQRRPATRPRAGAGPAIFASPRPSPAPPLAARPRPPPRSSGSLALTWCRPPRFGRTETCLGGAGTGTWRRRDSGPAALTGSANRPRLRRRLTSTHTLAQTQRAPLRQLPLLARLRSRLQVPAHLPARSTAGDNGRVPRDLCACARRGLAPVHWLQARALPLPLVLSLALHFPALYRRGDAAAPPRLGGSGRVKPPWPALGASEIRGSEACLGFLSDLWPARGTSRFFVGFGGGQEVCRRPGPWLLGFGLRCMLRSAPHPRHLCTQSPPQETWALLSLYLLLPCKVSGTPFPALRKP